jgi:hypothetical protein
MLLNMECKVTFALLVNTQNVMYEGRSKLIWTRLICSNFTILRLHTVKMLAQHIHLLDYTSLPSLWALTDGVTEPRMNSFLCSFRASVAAPYPADSGVASRYFLRTNHR